MSQYSLFGSGDDEPADKPIGDREEDLQVLITVKAAPNPSERYGETVCVAGLSTDLNRPGWYRLYPINFRDLDNEGRFKKYDVVSVRARPARQDQRKESWKPIMSTLEVTGHLDPWRRRREWLDSYIEPSMCRINQDARSNTSAKSLALVQPAEVVDVEIERHPGWTRDEADKIKRYVSQLEIPLGEQSRNRTALEAPRFRGWYRYRCFESSCRTHRQGILDWEFVSLQRTLSDDSEEVVKRKLQETFLDMMCASKRLTAFYVGNQAKRTNVFSVLGTYYPGNVA